MRFIGVGRLGLVLAEDDAVVKYVLSESGFVCDRRRKLLR